MLFSGTVFLLFSIDVQQVIILVSEIIVLKNVPRYVNLIYRKAFFILLELAPFLERVLRITQLLVFGYHVSIQGFQFGSHLLFPGAKNGPIILHSSLASLFILGSGLGLTLRYCVSGLLY